MPSKLRFGGTGRPTTALPDSLACMSDEQWKSGKVELPRPETPFSDSQDSSSFMSVAASSSFSSPSVLSRGIVGNHLSLYDQTRNRHPQIASAPAKKRLWSSTRHFTRGYTPVGPYRSSISSRRGKDVEGVTEGTTFDDINVVPSQEQSAGPSYAPHPHHRHQHTALAVPRTVPKRRHSAGQELDPFAIRHTQQQAAFGPPLSPPSLHHSVSLSQPPCRQYSLAEKRPIVQGSQVISDGGRLVDPLQASNPVITRDPAVDNHRVPPALSTVVEDKPSTLSSGLRQRTGHDSRNANVEVALDEPHNAPHILSERIGHFYQWTQGEALSDRIAWSDGSQSRACFDYTPLSTRPENAFEISQDAWRESTKFDIAVQYITHEIPKEFYNTLLLRLPLVYFSRVTKIFEEADLSLSEIKKMALELGSSSQSLSFEPLDLESYNTPPAYRNLRQTWQCFIEALIREWKTFNIISVLLLTAILTLLQIESAANDGLTRYTALSSLICALISLLYGCMYSIRFSTMRKTYKAAEWALEGQKSKGLIFWNVWVLLAMPAVWLSWSLILYICCIMSFLWRTGTQEIKRSPPSDGCILAVRIGISIILGVGMMYGVFIIFTFRRYGEAMDKKWKQRIKGWTEAKGSSAPFVWVPRPYHLQNSTFELSPTLQKTTAHDIDMEGDHHVRSSLCGSTEEQSCNDATTADQYLPSATNCEQQGTSRHLTSHSQTTGGTPLELGCVAVQGRPGDFLIEDSRNSSEAVALHLASTNPTGYLSPPDTPLRARRYKYPEETSLSSPGLTGEATTRINQLSKLEDGIDDSSSTQIDGPRAPSVNNIHLPLNPQRHVASSSVDTSTDAFASPLAPRCAISPSIEAPVNAQSPPPLPPKPSTRYVQQPKVVLTPATPTSPSSSFVYADHCKFEGESEATPLIQKIE